MTTTLLSLISVFIGIVATNLMGFIYRKYSLGLIGNTIAGVFGSVFFIKSFGKLGFDPNFIMQTGDINYLLFTINTLVSFFGGIIAVILINKLKSNINKND